MLKLYIMRGLPGSGKTTAARELMSDDPTLKRLNKSQLREMLDLGVYSGRNEKAMNRLMLNMGRMLFLSGYSVIADSTYLDQGHVRQWHELAKNTAHQGKRTIRVHEVPLNTSVEDCIRRNAARNKEGRQQLAEEVIQKMYEQYLAPGTRFGGGPIPSRVTTYRYKAIEVVHDLDEFTSLQPAERQEYEPSPGAESDTDRRIT